MNLQLGQADINIQQENEEEGTKKSSNAFIYMDMDVFTEEQQKNYHSCNSSHKTPQQVEIKKEAIHNHENLPLNEYQSFESLPLERNKHFPEVTTTSALQQEINLPCATKERTLMGNDCHETATKTSHKTLSQYNNKQNNQTDSKNSLQTKSISKRNILGSLKCSSCQEPFMKKSFIQEVLTVSQSGVGSSSCKYLCFLCNESFNQRHQIHSHLLKHNDDQSLICLPCYNRKQEAEAINSSDTNKDFKTLDVFTCDICKRTFTQMTKLKKHISAHLNGESNPNEDDDGVGDGCSDNHSETTEQHNYPHVISSFKCPKCNKDFSESVPLIVHLHRKHGVVHNCTKCNRTFESEEKLASHSAQANCSQSVRTCSKCGDPFAEVVSAANYVPTPGETWNQCENCRKLLDKRQQLEGHVTSSTCQKGRRGRTMKKHNCEHCGRTFAKLVKLKIHVLSAHEGVRYECEKCSKKFSNREGLQNHEAGNSCKENTCTCKVCGKVFAKRDYLKKHEYVHTNVLFKCKYCYCAFMKEKSYARHMEKMNCSKSARKIKMAEFNFRKCRLCASEYDTEDLLINHFTQNHPGENAHQCFCCDSSLPTFQDLQAHIHHHNVKKYTCNLCGKPYTSQEGFRKHRLKHKGAELKCQYCHSEFLNEGRFKFHVKTCKRNPETGYDPSATNPNTKDDKPKQSRQLHWESRIIIKHLRGDSKSGQETSTPPTLPNSFAFFDDTEPEDPNERGWFDSYYNTRNDDLTFGLKKQPDSDGCVTRNPQDPAPTDTPNSNTTTTTLKISNSTSTQPSTPQNNTPTDMPNNTTPSDTSSEDSDSSEDHEEDPEEGTQLPIDYDPKKCRLCGAAFAQEYELLHHFIKTHPQEKAHKCPSCDVQSPLFAQLKEHMKAHGIGMGIYNCDNCSKKFRSEKKMKSHNRRCKQFKWHHETPGARCKKCGKQFATKLGYQRHRQLCKLKKARRKAAQTRETLPPLQDPMGPTNECEPPGPNARSAPTDDHQKESQSKHLCAVEPPMDSFPCRLCDSKFQYERGLVMHFKSAHPGHKPLVCTVCNMHLADKLKEHLKTHGIGEEFICELCGKRFNQKFLSKIHELWHQGIEYKCTNCKQKFLNRQKMDKHVQENRCSNRQSLMRLPCSICGRSYRSRFGLSKHYITHTPKELRPVKNKMNCEFCGKWFDNNNGLQRHRRIHTGEKPFFCRYCPKAFAQDGNCKAHERIHTGEPRPRKKKPLAPPPPQNPLPELATLETVPYPPHINLYLYNSIDAEEIVH